MHSISAVHSTAHTHISKNHALICEETPQTFSLFSYAKRKKSKLKSLAHTHNVHTRLLRYCSAASMRKWLVWCVVGYRFIVFTVQHISQIKHLKRSGFVFIKLCFCLFISFAVFIFSSSSSTSSFLSFACWFFIFKFGCVIGLCIAEVNYWQTSVYEIR